MQGLHLDWGQLPMIQQEPPLVSHITALTDEYTTTALIMVIIFTSHCVHLLLRNNSFYLMEFVFSTPYFGLFKSLIHYYLAFKGIVSSDSACNSTLWKLCESKHIEQCWEETQLNQVT